MHDASTRVTRPGHAPTDPSVWHTFMVHRPCAVYVYRESESDRESEEVMHEVGVMTSSPDVMTSPPLPPQGVEVVTVTMTD